MSLSVKLGFLCSFEGFGVQFEGFCLFPLYFLGRVFSDFFFYIFLLHKKSGGEYFQMYAIDECLFFFKPNFHLISYYLS